MKILIAGDFCPRARTETLINKEQFNLMFGGVKPLIESADYSLVNLECPVVSGQNVEPIMKSGGHLRCTEKAVDALKYIGFKSVTLANNHILDFGPQGLYSTLNACKSRNIDYVGVGANINAASSNLIKEISGKKIAFINCCEHEFSIATDVTPGANPLNPIQQYYSIQKIRSEVDYIIVIVHGGHEHYQLPSPRMKELYHFFIDSGADVVINHHQHCFSGYELYNSKPIFYGLGNFFFDKDGSNSGKWTEGYIVELTLSDTITFTLHPYSQCAIEPIIQLYDSFDDCNFRDKITQLNTIIENDSMLKEAYECWIKQSSLLYELALSPLKGRLFVAAAARKLIPTFLSKSKLITILNFVDCESHRDKLLLVLKNKIKL